MERKTPLYDRHTAAGGKLVPFAGWLLPVQYSGVIAEHRAVRTGCGLFDVSHMGELLLRGPDALANLNRLMTNDFSGMADGQARYSPMCYEDGGVVDDLIVYRCSDTAWLAVVNASNTGKDRDWMAAHLSGDCTLEDLSDQKWTADMVDISKPDITHEGRIYGFPVGIEGYGYMYRADLFKQAGIETAPKNLDELRNCAGRLKDMGVTPFVNTWGAWYQAGMFYMNAAIAQQEDPYAFIEGLNAGENLIEGNEAFIRLAEMIKLDFDNCDSPLNTDFAAQVSKFGSGTAAMACGGTWNQPSLDDVDPDMEAGLIPMPFMEKDEDNDVLYAGVTTYWVINKDSAVKDAAKEFLNWLVYDEEGQSFLVTELKNIPAFSNITTGTDSIGPLGQTLLSYLEEGKVKGIYNSRYPAGTVQAFGTSIQKFAAGNISQEQLLKELQDTWTSSRR